MPIKTACSHCGKAYTVEEKNLGKQVKCRACGESFVLGKPVPRVAVGAPSDKASEVPTEHGEAVSEDAVATSRPPAKGRVPEPPRRAGRKAGRPRSGGKGLAPLVPLIAGGAAAVFFLGMVAFAFMASSASEARDTAEGKLKQVEAALAGLSSQGASTEEKLGSVRERLDESVAALRELQRPALFVERFGDADVNGAWAVLAGDARVVDGELELSRKGGVCIACRVWAVGDLQIEYDARIVAAGADGQFSDLSCFFASTVEKGVSGGYFVGLGTHYNVRHKVLRLAAEAKEVPAAVLAVGVPFRVKVRWQRGTLTLSYRRLDQPAAGEQVALEYTDPEPLRGEDHTIFGLYSFGCTARFDNVRVSRP